MTAPSILDALAARLVTTTVADVLDARTTNTRILTDEVAPLDHDDVVLLLQRVLWLTGALGASVPDDKRRAMFARMTKTKEA